MGGTCQTLNLTGPIDAMRAGYSGDAGAVNSVQYLKGSVTKTYGELSDHLVNWAFDDDYRLLGLHGSTTDGVITSFAVIVETAGDTCPGQEEPTSEETEGSANDNDEKCECLSNNGVERVKRDGEKVIIYTDGDGNEYQYPAKYGTQCIAWDEVLPPYCGDENSRPLTDQPEWCAAAWCYVDPETCNRSDVERSAYFGDSYELYYSYGNCGASDSFTGTDYEGEEDGDSTDTTDSTATDGGESGAISMAFTTASIVLSSILFF